MRPLKVVSIAHPAGQEGIARLRYEPLVNDPGIDLTVIVPDQWREYGRDLAIDPNSSPLDLRIEPIRMKEAGKAKWYMHHYRRLGALLKELQPDVIHLWEEPWSLVAVQAAWLRRRNHPNASLILETDQNILRPLPFPFEQIRKMTLRRTDLLIVRQDEALKVSQACGYEGPSVVVEYCVDSKRFYPSPTERQAAREGFGFESFSLGYVGRLIEEKGLFTVIDAVSRCERDVDFYLIGDGPDKARLMEYAATQGVQDKVHFLPPAPQSEVARFMRALDAFVLMSLTTSTWKEQFGRVIIEAQACGVPVIGSSSGSIPGVVGNGGWIVPEGDAAALASLIGRLAVDPIEVHVAGVAGLEHVRRRFSQEAVAQDLRRAFVESAQVRQARGLEMEPAVFSS